MIKQSFVNSNGIAADCNIFIGFTYTADLTMRCGATVNSNNKILRSVLRNGVAGDSNAVSDTIAQSDICGSGIFADLRVFRDISVVVAVFLRQTRLTASPRRKADRC